MTRGWPIFCVWSFETFLKRDIRGVKCILIFPVHKNKFVKHNSHEKIKWVLIVTVGFYCYAHMFIENMMHMYIDINLLIPCLFYFISQKKSVVAVLFSGILVSHYKTATVIPFVFFLYVVKLVQFLHHFFR